MITWCVFGLPALLIKRELNKERSQMFPSSYLEVNGGRTIKRRREKGHKSKSPNPFLLLLYYEEEAVCPLRLSSSQKRKEIQIIGQDLTKWSPTNLAFLHLIHGAVAWKRKTQLSGRKRLIPSPNTILACFIKLSFSAEVILLFCNCLLVSHIWAKASRGSLVYSEVCKPKQRSHSYN